MMAGAFAVRGQQKVRRSRMQQGEADEESLFSEPTTASNTPSAVPSTSTSTTQQSQPILVQAEIARAPEDLYAENEGLQAENQGLQAQNQGLSEENRYRERLQQEVVVEAEEVDGQDGELLKANSTKQRQSQLFIVTVVVPVVLVVIGVAVGVPLALNPSSSSSSSGDDINNGTTASPTAASPNTTIAPTPIPVGEPSAAPVDMSSPSTLPTKKPTLLPTVASTNSPMNPSLLDGAWEQLGQNLTGSAIDDGFALSVSLSTDGTVMAVGATQDISLDPGYVSVFRFDASLQSWTSLGQDLVGKAVGDQFGYSVSLIGDGTILAVGAIWNDSDGGTNAGHVQVYAYNNDGEWVQQGDDIEGQECQEVFGGSVSLSDAGDVLAVGATLTSTSNGQDTGSVRLYQYNRTMASWTQLGQTLIGRATDDQFGFSVSLSGSGTVAAIGAPDNDESGGVRAGQVSVFQCNDEAWEIMDVPINGQVVDGRFGWSVSLDQNGTVMSVGAPRGCSSCDFVLGSVSVFNYDNARESLDTTWSNPGERGG